MSLPRFSVTRPVTTFMIYAGIVLLGAISLKMLKVELLPSLDIPKIVVETKAPDMPPEEVDQTITQKIESQLSTLPDVKRVTSVSTDGKSLVTVEFYWGVNMEYTMLKAREKLDMVKDDIGDAEKPNILYFDPAQAPVMQVMVEPKQGNDFLEISRFASDYLKYRIERLEGVAVCEVVGADTEEIRVLIKNRDMISYGLSFNDISRALQQNNIAASAGEIGDENFSYSLSLEKNRFSVEEIGNLSISTTVKLKDVAVIERGVKKNDEITRYNGDRGVGLFVIKSSSANTVNVCREVRKLIQEFKKESNTKDKVELSILYDDSDTILQAIANIAWSVVWGGILSFFVLFIFLHDFRTPLIIGFAMPLSIITTFVGMYFFGISFNILSLGGLAIGIGLLTDNSVVVMENIDRYREEGLTVKESIIRGATEMAPSILVGTLTTIVVFLPVLYLKGVVAVLFKEQALIITMALLASLIIALTFVPMLLYVLKMERFNAWFIQKAKKIFSWFDEMLLFVLSKYQKQLVNVLENKKKIIMITAIVFLITISMGMTIRREFVPPVKEDKFFLEYSLPTGATIDANMKYVKLIENILEEKKDVIRYHIANVGKSYSNSIAGVNTGYFLIATQSIHDVEPLKKHISDTLLASYGIEYTFYSAGSVYNQFFDFGEYDLDLMLEGDDIEQLNVLADTMRQALKKDFSWITAIEKDLELEREILELRFKDYFIASSTVPLYEVVEQLKKVTVGVKTTTIYDGSKEIDIWLKNDENTPSKQEFLERMIVVGKTEYKVGDIVELRSIKVPNELKREDQRRKVSLLCNIKGKSLEKAVIMINDTFKTLNGDKPIKLKIGGKIENMKESFSGLWFAFGLALLLVYMLIGMQFESFLQPVIIMLAVPMALIGSLTLMLLTHTSFNIMSLMGIVVATGIVVNDSILEIDTINTLMREGMPLIEAVKKGCTMRFRPILMTSLTTILGLFPLALGIGKGSELSQPLAITLIGGLMTSTALTLVVLPALFVTLMKRFSFER